MTKPVATPSPLQTLLNAQCIKRAEQQYRLATLFTPYGYQPERVDFDRVEAFLDNPARAFPQPTDGIKNALSRIGTVLTEANALIGALAAQGVEATLTPDQLFATAQANVRGNRTNTAMYAVAS